MEIAVAEQRLRLFDPKISFDEAKSTSWTKRMTAFGAINKVASIFSKPGDDDFELLYSEHRHQPFWHVAARASYEYERRNEYSIPSSGPEVCSVTYEHSTREVDNGKFTLPVVEHCRQEESTESFVDGITGKSDVGLKSYLSFSSKVLKGDLGKAVEKGSIIVPPASRVSAIMRESLAKMIKGIQADTILKEEVEVTSVDLYYHPVYAFQYRWKSKNKDAIVEVDGLTGQVSSGSRVFREYLGKVLNTDFLFDIGADAAGMIIPGGSIAVKVAKQYLKKK